MSKKFTKKQIPQLNYGVLHSQFGHVDGVSIVMHQIEHVMQTKLHIPKKQIHYLVGASRLRDKRIRKVPLFYLHHPVTKMMVELFKEGYGGQYNEAIEQAIQEGKEAIEKFVTDKKLDVLIAHNACHPVNFIMALSLHRYYRDAIKVGKKTPKYLLWWHDSHLERKHFQHPAADVNRYLIEGVPGNHVEYILFINSLQFHHAEDYLRMLDRHSKGFYDHICAHHDVVYNTTDTFIDTYDDLETDKYSDRVDKFLHDFQIEQTLKAKGLKLDDVLFVLQHTRIVKRKRIDFALQYCFELAKQLRKKKVYKGIYFFVSGHKDDYPKKDLQKLHRRLSKEHGIDTVMLVFAENTKTDIKFEEYPRIFAKLSGIATYFSEVEGFGNNLLEILASGLIPVVYKYPVFKTDIAKYRFKLIALDEFAIDEQWIKKTVSLIKSSRMKKIWANRNLEILRKYFDHKIIATKLKRAIIRARLHR